VKPLEYQDEEEGERERGECYAKLYRKWERFRGTVPKRGNGYAVMGTITLACGSDGNGYASVRK
jgi:hypothetical protein